MASLLSRAMGLPGRMIGGAVAGAIGASVLSDDRANVFAGAAAGALHPFGYKAAGFGAGLAYLGAGGRHSFIASLGMGAVAGGMLGRAIGTRAVPYVGAEARRATSMGVGHVLQYEPFPRPRFWGARTAAPSIFGRPSAQRIVRGATIAGASVGLGLGALGYGAAWLTDRDGFGGGNGFLEDTAHFAARSAQVSALYYGIPMLGAAAVIGHRAHGFGGLKKAAGLITNRRYPALTLFGGALLVGSFASAMSGQGDTEFRANAREARSMRHDNLNTQGLGLALHYARGL